MAPNFSSLIAVLTPSSRRLRHRILLAVAFVFLLVFFLVRLLSKVGIGNYRPIRKV
jgi:hypothetical protein